MADRFEFVIDNFLVRGKKDHLAGTIGKCPEHAKAMFEAEPRQRGIDNERKCSTTHLDDRRDQRLSENLVGARRFVDLLKIVATVDGNHPHLAVRRDFNAIHAFRVMCHRLPGQRHLFADLANFVLKGDRNESVDQFGVGSSMIGVSESGRSSIFLRRISAQLCPLVGTFTRRCIHIALSATPPINELVSLLLQFPQSGHLVFDFRCARFDLKMFPPLCIRHIPRAVEPIPMFNRARPMPDGRPLPAGR